MELETLWKAVVRLRAIALAAVLVALTGGYAEAQRSVWTGRTVTMAAATGQQVEIRMAGTCDSNVTVRIVLMAEVKGVFNDGVGPFSMTVGGNSVSCRGANVPYTAVVSLHRDSIWNLEKLRLEAKGAWSVVGVTAVYVTSDDDDLNGWLVPLEQRLVW